MNLAQDIRTMLTLAAPLAGSIPIQATLPGGSVVQTFPSVASQEDSLISGDLVVYGQTRKLTFSSDDVIGLKSQQNITWNGQSWGLILGPILDANGSMTSFFLGSPF